MNLASLRSRLRRIEHRRREMRAWQPLPSLQARLTREMGVTEAEMERAIDAVQAAIEAGRITRDNWERETAAVAIEAFQQGARASNTPH